MTDLPESGAQPIECEDCGEPCKRRTRCPRCKYLLCNWCYSHVHTLPVQALYCSRNTMKGIKYGEKVNP